MDNGYVMRFFSKISQISGHFLQLTFEKKDTILDAARKIFGPSYFMMALTCQKLKNLMIIPNSRGLETDST